MYLYPEDLLKFVTDCVANGLVEFNRAVGEKDAGFCPMEVFLPGGVCWLSLI